ncbi:murein hydrolase activator EnvC family protein [Agrococcus beijingensis]|uniref:murein hydrolase activator EnvC family protein n=1 Tax=Agrococcus beijingensis TaxID=3068634 RepID=UPI0027408D4D|nr:M23 family metallopeptidase [Agrococcus sp. REN33]
MRILALLLIVTVGAWGWPVASHEVARAFDPPATPYGSGHRGIDIAATAGAPVVSPDDGTVRFAGPVAGRPVVSIDHGGGLVSSFEPVEPLVATGEPVARGQRIGTLLAGHVAGEARLHLGARLHGAYIDPLPLLGVERPVLLPRGAGKASARRLLPGPAAARRVRPAGAPCGRPP